MKTLKIVNTEIIDNATHVSETGKQQPSEISVLVEIKYDDNDYFLDFQTTTTADYGAFSSSLSPYEGTDSYDDLKEVCGDDFDSVIDAVEEKSECKKMWSEYVDENYKRNTGHFGGMDGNSEVNEMVRV